MSFCKENSENKKHQMQSDINVASISAILKSKMKCRIRGLRSWTTNTKLVAARHWYLVRGGPCHLSYPRGLRLLCICNKVFGRRKKYDKKGNKIISKTQHMVSQDMQTKRAVYTQDSLR